MSVIGTGVAAGVAQSQHQAQQVSRRQHREKSQSADDARRVKQMLEAHLQALDEGDEAIHLTQLRIDEQVPEHERHADVVDDTVAAAKRTDDDGDAAGDEAASEDSVASPPSTPKKKKDDDRGLYKHVDVTA